MDEEILRRGLRELFSQHPVSNLKSWREALSDGWGDDGFRVNGAHLTSRLLTITGKTFSVHELHQNKSIILDVIDGILVVKIMKASENDQN